MSRIIGILLVGATGWLCHGTGWAQQLPPWQEFDSFFEQMLPRLTEQERERLAAIPVSVQEERQLGRQALELLLQELQQRDTKVLRRGKEVDYLKGLLHVVQPQMQQPQRYRNWEIYLVDSPFTEARCFPGGFLVFYRGLLDFAESEAALVGVVAHELSHLDRGHALLTLRIWKQTQQQWTANPQRIDPQQWMGQGMLLARTLGRPFRPEDEAQADRDAVLWTFRAGYDPRELAELFLRLQRRDEKLTPPLPSFLRSHPVAAERYRDTLQQARQLLAQQPGAECYVGRPNLAQRIPRDRKRFP